jgi:hypothetical protein
MDRSQAQLKTMLGFDLTQLNEVVISVRPEPAAKTARGLVILGGSFDPDHPPAVLAFLPNEKSAHEGVPLLLIRPKEGEPVAVAFLGRTTILLGDPASVRAAISRANSGTASHSPVLAKAQELSRTFHVWCAARDLRSLAAHGAQLPAAAGPIQAAFQSLEEITLGMNLLPGFLINLELLASSAKDAAALEGAAHAGIAFAMAQQQAPEKTKELLNGLKITSDDRTLKLSLAISEEKMIEAFKEQMKQGSPWWKGPHPQEAPRNTEVVVQGGDTAPKADVPKSGATQVVTLPR